MKAKKNIALFVIIALIVAVGLFTLDVPKLLGGTVLRVAKRQESVAQAIVEIDSNLSERLSYQQQLLDFNSLVLRCTGTRIVDKDDTTIVLSEDNYLTTPFPKVSDQDIAYVAAEVKKLKTVANDNGADFLYVFAPSKSMDVAVPPVAENNSFDNYQRFVSALNDAEIEVLDLYQKKCDDGISTQEMFFITDHHWKPEYGFWANGLICQELNERYGFEYSSMATDINQYDVQVYEDWFLGSWGKKVGKYFSPLGIDDISLITPNFETSLVEEQPFKDERREGDFTQTALELSNIDEKDIHTKNPYAVYSGGDFRLQVFKNNLPVNDDRILVIRDSYACAVTPFLALNAKELYLTDVRDYEYYVGEKLNLKDYIQEIKPDYVIVLYNGISAVDSSSDRYNFF